MRKLLQNVRHLFKRVSFLRWIEVLLVILVFFFLFFSSIDQLPIHPDEIDWISSSGFYEAYVGLKFADPIWVEHRWTLNQPPLPRYIIGLGRSLGGYPISTLNLPDDFHVPNSVSVFIPIEIIPAVLFWSRLPAVVLAAGSFAILFSLLRGYLDWLPAWLFVLFTWGNKYLVDQLVRAMAEAPLIFFVSLCMSVAVTLLNSTDKMAQENRHNQISPQYRAWFALGIFSGLAASSKNKWNCFAWFQR